jgi:hypothetical protein
MGEISGPVAWALILTLIGVIAVIVWVQAGDIFTGQGCDMSELCTRVANFLPEWLR